MIDVLKIMQRKIAEGKRPKAYVFDIDATVLSAKTAPKFRGPQDIPAFNAWALQGDAEAVPAGKELYNQALAEGAEVHFITAREPLTAEATIRNLKAQGMGTFASYHTKPSGVDTVAFKSEVRAQIAKDRNIVANVGDSFTDFWGGNTGRAMRIIKEGTVAPFRRATIEGLFHGGMAQKLRKILTSFGSPYQGLPEGYEVTWRTGFRDQGFIGTIKHEGKQIGFLKYAQEGQSATMQDIKITGFVTPGMTQAQRKAAAELYQGKKLGQGAYKEAFFHARERGAVEFTSDVRGTTSDIAKARIWESKAFAPIVEKRGALYRADLKKLEMLGESVMKTGEGAAIAKAGTAEVSSVLKATSRIIRGAL